MAVLQVGAYQVCVWSLEIPQHTHLLTSSVTLARLIMTSEYLQVCVSITEF